MLKLILLSLDTRSPQVEKITESLDGQGLIRQGEAGYIARGGRESKWGECVGEGWGEQVA